MYVCTIKNQMSNINVFFFVSTLYECYVVRGAFTGLCQVVEVLAFYLQHSKQTIYSFTYNMRQKNVSDLSV